MGLFKRGIGSTKEALSELKEELDEHLTSINENTGEIQSNYSYVQKLNNRLDQLNARLDRIEMMLDSQPKKRSIQPLTRSEKQVFLVLYTEESPLTYADIAQKTGFAEALVKHYVGDLIEKGIPLVKSYFNNTPFLKIHPSFKELQAKENVINLSLKSFVDDKKF